MTITDEIKANAVNYGKESIWLRGSREYIYRNVYGVKRNDMVVCYIKYDGHYIEVKRGNCEYYTVEYY